MVKSFTLINLKYSPSLHCFLSNSRSIILEQTFSPEPPDLFACLSSTVYRFSQVRNNRVLRGSGSLSFSCFTTIPLRSPLLFISSLKLRLRQFLGPPGIGLALPV